MAASLAIAERHVGSCSVLHLSGRLVADDDARLLAATVDQLIARGARQFVLNLHDVTALDSGGVGTIVAKYHSAHRAGGDLKLASLSSHARHVLGIAGLLRIFETFDSDEAAAASFRAAASTR